MQRLSSPVQKVKYWCNSYKRNIHWWFENTIHFSHQESFHSFSVLRKKLLLWIRHLSIDDKCMRARESDFFSNVLLADDLVPVLFRCLIITVTRKGSYLTPKITRTLSDRTGSKESNRAYSRLKIFGVHLRIFFSSLWRVSSAFSVICTWQLCWVHLSIYSNVRPLYILLYINTMLFMIVGHLPSTPIQYSLYSILSWK